MSNFKEALIETSDWLQIPGVETIIPNTDDKSFMVLISCETPLMCELIPEQFHGFFVHFHYVHGLKVNT